MDLRDIVPIPATRVQKTTIKNSKSSKTVPFHAMKRNPYLDMDTGADTVGQSGSENVSGTVGTSLQNADVGGSNEIPRLRHRVSKITPFKPQLKRKCHITDCIQCNMKKCQYCSACKNPQWKKGCINKEPCPNLNPRLSPVENDCVPSILDKTIVPEDNDDDDISNKHGIDYTAGNANTQDNTTNITTTDVAEYSLQSVITVNDLNMNSGQTTNENEEYQANVSEFTVEAAMSENREDTTEKENVNMENAASNQKQGCAEVKWHCEICNKLFSYSTSLNNHKCGGSKVKIPCVSCNKLISKKFMPIHTKLHSSLIINCPKCKRKFTSEEKLQQHMTIHNTKVQRCDVCGESFPSKSSLLKHAENSHEKVSTAHLKTETKCKFCDEVFSNLALFRKHLKTAHMEMASFKCSSCPKGYFSSRGLRIHRETHKEVPASERSEVSLSKENPPVVLPLAADNYVIDVAKDIGLEELIGSDVTFVESSE